MGNGAMGGRYAGMRIFSDAAIQPVARGLGLFLGLFTLLNLAGAWRSPGFDANAWWIDVGALPAGASRAGLLVAGAALTAFGLGAGRRPGVRRAVGWTAAAATALVFWNALWFYGLWLGGRIRPGFPVPFSLLLAVALSVVARAAFAPAGRLSRGQGVACAAVFAAACVLFPLGQMVCFGKTDYRRRADAAVVFGARTYADGTPSQALADRVRTAIGLYREGLVPVLIFSGGPGDGMTSEPAAMRALAESLGVPPGAIVLDEAGLTTGATVGNTVPLFRSRGFTRVLAVSHFYHLPRVKMTYTRALRAAGVETSVYTVPAEESSPLRQMPWYMAREVAALWAYYLRPFAAGWRGNG
jgi:vancomycin permeability regulator SanA